MIFWAGLALALFQLLVPVLTDLFDMQLRALHVALATVVITLAVPISRGAWRIARNTARRPSGCSGALRRPSKPESAASLAVSSAARTCEVAGSPARMSSTVVSMQTRRPSPAARSHPAQIRLTAAAVSGVPSTAYSLAAGDDVLEGGRAAGAILLPRERRTPVLLAAGALVHLALSLGWAAVLAALLPRRHEPLHGLAGGLAIAALDLAVIGRAIPAIRALPQGRQWADHVAYGATVGMVLAVRCSAQRPE